MLFILQDYQEHDQEQEEQEPEPEQQIEQEEDEERQAQEEQEETQEEESEQQEQEQEEQEPEQKQEQESDAATISEEPTEKKSFLHSEESSNTSAVETNGIDNEDSINLTIGEDEENLLAEEVSLKFYCYSINRLSLANFRKYSFT